MEKPLTDLKGSKKTLVELYEDGWLEPAFGS